MDLLRLLKKLAFMPLVITPLLGGCFLFDDPKEESYSQIAGFASDTTAILFSYNWETTEEPLCAKACNTSKEYLDIELKLVDVRFKKVYWKAKVKNNYGGLLNAKPWNDSTIIIYCRDKCSSDYMLWSIGKSKPQEITFNWNTEKKSLSDYTFLRWENDSILAYPDLVIDTKTKTVNRRETICTNWWGKVAGGGCLIKDENSCGFSLLSEKGDTLSSFTYAYECNDFKHLSGNRYFIYFSFGSCSDSYTSECHTYPIEIPQNERLGVFIRFDEKGNISQKPSFWLPLYGTGISFIDSLGNVVEY